MQALWLNNRKLDWAINPLLLQFYETKYTILLLNLTIVLYSSLLTSVNHENKFILN